MTELWKYPPLVRVYLGIVSEVASFSAQMDFPTETKFPCRADRKLSKGSFLHNTKKFKNKKEGGQGGNTLGPYCFSRRLRDECSQILQPVSQPPRQTPLKAAPVREDSKEFGLISEGIYIPLNSVYDGKTFPWEELQKSWSENETEWLLALAGQLLLTFSRT